MDNESIRTTLTNMNTELDLNQRSFLLDCVLKFDKTHWYNEEAKSKIWQFTEFLTERKYRWLLHLFYASKDQHKSDEERKLAGDKFKSQIEEIINL